MIQTTWSRSYAQVVSETKVLAGVVVVLLLIVGGLVVWRVTDDDDDARGGLVAPVTTTVGSSSGGLTSSSVVDPTDETIEVVFARYDAIETEWDLFLRGVDTTGASVDPPNLDSPKWNEWFSGSESSARASQFRQWIKAPADAVGGTFERAGARTTTPDESTTDGIVVLGDCVFEARFGVVKQTGLAPEGGGASQLQYRLVTLKRQRGQWSIDRVETFVDSEVCTLTFDPAGAPVVSWTAG